ncbi:MAG: hypothetical protein Kow0063_11400 [Anaerolineae bacterium]
MITITHLGVVYPAIPGLLRRLRVLLSRLAPDMALSNYETSKTECESPRLVSVLFTDIAGFSELMNTWPLESVVSSLSSYFERLSRCIYRHNGQVDKFIGDGMLAVFQSPDDAVNAARAIQREVALYNTGQARRRRCAFPTRIVVDTGPVVRTRLGLGRDRGWTVMGPVVNTASHLVKSLPPGKVFMSHATCCRLTERGDLWLTVAQGTDRNGNRMAVYEIPSPDVESAGMGIPALQRGG